MRPRSLVTLERHTEGTAPSPSSMRFNELWMVLIVLSMVWLASSMRFNELWMVLIARFAGHFGRFAGHFGRLAGHFGRFAEHLELFLVDFRLLLGLMTWSQFELQFQIRFIKLPLNIQNQNLRNLVPNFSVPQVQILVIWVNFKLPLGTSTRFLLNRRYLIKYNLITQISKKYYKVVVGTNLS